MTTPKAPFPRTFYFANAIELLERLAHYGLYIGLSLYLTDVVKMDDVDAGRTLGNWRFFGAMAPILCGAIADRLGFRRSLILAFVCYSAGYACLLAFPTRLPAIGSLFLAAFGGGFMKPVITGTVIRTSPEGRQTEGFAIFYRMINAGSVIGKTLAYGVRILVALRFVAFSSVAASLAALSVAVFGYEEPADGANAQKGPALGELLRGYAQALRNLRFAALLVVFAGFYFMAEQFYMTFPKYVTRHIDPKAPLELITLINPALIAIGASFVSGVMKRFHPVTVMAIGLLIGALSMFVMGAAPNYAGAILSGGLYAVAEMTCSPRFYDYVASFAPKGRAGMYMGLAFVPYAIGAWIGGQVSGPLIARYMPATGPRDPFTLWSTYAGLGVACAALMLLYGAVTRVWSASRRSANGH